MRSRIDAAAVRCKCAALGARGSGGARARGSHRCGRPEGSRARCPATRGWILDECGAIREHINVFVNKECGRADTSVAAGDRTPRHSGDLRRVGGHDAARSERRRACSYWTGHRVGPSTSPHARSRASPSSSPSVTREPAGTSRVLTSPFYGPKLFYTDDLAAEWRQAEGIELPARKAMTRPLGRHAGRGGRAARGWRPGVLFESRDGGETWALNKRVLGAAHAARLEPWGRRHVHALDRTWPGRSVAHRTRDLGGGGLAFGRRWPEPASRQQRPLPRYMPEEARTDTSISASTTCTARRRSLSGCSCNSTAVSTGPTIRRDLGVDRRRPAFDFSSSPMVLDPEDPDMRTSFPSQGPGPGDA